MSTKTPGVCIIDRNQEYPFSHSSWGGTARIVTDTNVTNGSVFNKLVSEYYSGKGVEDIFDEDIPEDLYEDE